MVWCALTMPTFETVQKTANFMLDLGSKEAKQPQKYHILQPSMRAAVCGGGVSEHTAATAAYRTQERLSQRSRNAAADLHPSSSCSKRRARHLTLGGARVRAAGDPDADDTVAEPEGQPNVFFRVMACLPYLVPLMGVLPFGKYINDSFPLYEGMMQLFAPLLQAYYSSWFTPFLVFFSLFLLIVRNKNLPHFVRFNTMQSILLDICAMLGGLTIQYLPFEIAYSWIGILLNNLTYMTGACTVFYCMLNILRGCYPEIPVVSEAVYMQVCYSSRLHFVYLYKNEHAD